MSVQSSAVPMLLINRFKLDKLTSQCGENNNENNPGKTNEAYKLFHSSWRSKRHNHSVNPDYENQQSTDKTTFTN